MVFTPYFPPNLGGLETLVGEYVGVLAARGHAVDVLTSSEPGNWPAEATWRGAAVHRVPMHSPLYRQDVKRITEVRRTVAALKRDLAPEILHVHLADGSVFFHSLTEHAHTGPTVVTVHSALAAREALPGTPLRRVLSSADWVTGCSQSMLHQTQRVVPDIDSHSSVILNGMDTERITVSPLPFDPPSVLLLGRLTPEKGFDVGLRACALAARAVPGMRVLLAGDGPKRDALRTLIEELDVGGVVETLGPVPQEEVPALLERATVVVMPSRYEEPFGLVAVEAGLAGRPVIATRMGGLPEVVEHGRNGLLVAPEDPDALAAAIAHVLGDRAAAARMGRAGRARAEDEFSLERHVDEFEALFERLLAAPATGSAP